MVTSAQDTFKAVISSVGSAVGGGVADSTKPVITGTAPVGDTVNIYDGVRLLGTATVAADGTWSYTPSADLKAGNHSFTAIAVDASGGYGATSAPLAVSVPSSTPAPATPAAPTFTDDSGHAIPAGSTTADGHPHINGTGTAGDTITVYDNGTAIGSTTVAANGTWTFTPTSDLSNGAHSINVTEANSAGTSAHSPSTAITIMTGTPATPAAPTFSDDSGANIPAGSTTTDVTPHINGTGTAGDTITVYDNGTAIGSTTVAGDGTWSFHPTTPLPSGNNSITVVDTNAAGTPSLPSNPTTLVVNPVVAPSTPAAPTFTDDSGHAIPAGSTTADGHPHINGTGTAGDIVTVYDGSTVLGTAVVAANGTWTFTPASDLSNGTHSINVTEANSAGASAHSPSTAITIMTGTPATPPAPTVLHEDLSVIPAGSTTTDSHPYFSGGGTPGDLITVYDGSTVLGSATVNSGGTWWLKPTVATALADGTHNINVTETNAAGTTSAHSPSTAITIMTGTPATPAAPTFSDGSGANIPAGSTTTDVTPHINGTGTAGDIITVYDNGTAIGSTTVAGDGTWSFTPTTPLPSGNNSITVVDTNAAGTSSLPSNPTTVVVNPVVAPSTPAAPTFTNDSGQAIAAGSTTADGHPHINGKGTAGDTVTVYDGSTVLGTATVAANGTWTFTPASDLSNGTHSINVTEGNSAGTSAHSPSTAITIMTGTPATPPAPVLSDDNGVNIPAGSTTNDGHPHISGTGTAGDTITVYDGSTVLGTATVAANGTWTFTPGSNLAQGAHSINVTDTNAAGTMSAHSANTAFTYSLVSGAPVITSVVDSVGPVQGNIPMGGYSDDPAPVFHGTGIAGYTVYLYDNGRGCGDTVVGADGTWTITPNNGISMGLNNMTATQFSSAAGAGNQSPASNTWTFTLMTGTPATPPAPTLTNDSNAPIPAGSTTNDGHPHISGTGTAGDKITVYDGSTVLGTATVAADGTWTFTPSSDVATGSHSINVTDTNAAGAISAHSASTSFTYSNVTAPPVITSIVDSVGPVQGNIPMNGYSDDPAPVFHGTGIAGYTIYLYDNGRGCGDTVVGADGTWTITPNNGIDSGLNNMTTTQFASGVPMSAASNTWTFTLDTHPLPKETVSITGLYDDTSGSQVLIAVNGSTKDTTPIVKGNVSTALLSDETLVVYRDNVKVGNATMNGTSWTFNDSGVAAGAHTYTAVVQNGNGSGTTSAGYSFTEAVAVQSYQLTAWCARNLDGGVTYAIQVPGYTIMSYTGTNSRGQQQQAFGSYGVVLYPGQPEVLAVKVDSSWGIIQITLINDTNGQTYVATTSGAELLRYMPYSYAGPSYSSTSPKTFTTSVLSAVHTATPVDSTFDNVVHVDAVVTTSAEAHHVTVGQNNSFTGTTGHDTVDLDADPTTYFKESTAHIEGSTIHPTDSAVAGASPASTPAVNTLHLTGDHQILDLTSLTGKTSAAKISGMEVIDLGGHENNLKLSLIDVLNLGEQDLFQKDGHQQMMVNGSEGDKVDLSNAHIAGVADGQWEQHGTAQVGGVTYNVYEHSGAHAELLIQQGVQIVLHN